MNTSQLRRSAGISQYGAVSRKPRRWVEGERKVVDKYRAKYQSLVTEKAEAEQDGDHQRVEEIEDEMAQIADAITAGVGKGGKLCKDGDKRKNVRDAFRNAVNRAIKQIAKWDKPLAEHLKASIKHGNEVVYRPGMPIAWDVRSIVNALPRPGRAGRLREGGFPDERSVENPRPCWGRCSGVLRRNREWAGTENAKPPETGVSGAVASVAAWPEPAPALGGTGKKNQPRVVGFLNSGGAGGN